MHRLVSRAALALAVGLPAAARADLNINVYGDVGARLEHAKDTSHSFQAPHVELLPSGSSGDFSFLAEINFEIGENNLFDASAERLEVGYLFADWLRLRAGRFHTALGYYNDAFHHGTYFLLPIDRPLWLDFEDGGGLIPSHSVGVHADGRFLFGFGGVRYDLDVANGRGPRLVEVQNRLDGNKTKAVNLRLRVEPNFLPGLVVGANVYFDKIAANDDPTLPAKIPELNERILGAHAAYLEGKFHLIAEAALFTHQEAAGSKTYTAEAFLLEAGYELGQITPYGVVERVNFDGGEVSPYFLTSPIGAAGSGTVLRAGAKWKADDHFALKLEGGQIMNDSAASASTTVATFQAAFAF